MERRDGVAADADRRPARRGARARRPHRAGGARQGADGVLEDPVRRPRPRGDGHLRVRRGRPPPAPHHAGGQALPLAELGARPQRVPLHGLDGEAPGRLRGRPLLGAVPAPRGLLPPRHEPGRDALAGRPACGDRPLPLGRRRPLPDRPGLAAPRPDPGAPHQLPRRQRGLALLVAGRPPPRLRQRRGLRLPALPCDGRRVAPLDPPRAGPLDPRQRRPRVERRRSDRLLRPAGRALPHLRRRPRREPVVDPSARGLAAGRDGLRGSVLGPRRPPRRLHPHRRVPALPRRARHGGEEPRPAARPLLARGRLVPPLLVRENPTP